MPRPDERPFAHLPILSGHRDALEKCAFCPKLCRTACPVSNAEPRESITPWGKMSLAYFAAQGDVQPEPTVASTAWACTGCMGCRESCDHKNEVAPVLYTARAGFAKRKLAPEGARRVAERFPRHAGETRQAVRELGANPRVAPTAKTALLLGCTYARAAMPEAKAAIDVVTTLTDEPVRLLESCCGLPLLLAGERDAFIEQARTFAAEAAGATRIVVLDPGCAVALRARYPEVDLALEAPVEPLVALAARELARLEPMASPPEAVRYHDPCHLGRGLGLYDEPRALLTRALGRPPLEFANRRERATCSGAGGLVPATMPATARAMAERRLAEHAEAGGSRVVTACASSLLAFRQRGGFPVDDLVTYVARSLPRRARPSGAPR